MTELTVDILITFFALLFGSFVFSSAGFGIAIAGSPFMLMTMDPKTIVVVINTVSLPLFVMIILQNRSYIDYRAMISPSVAGIAGVPFGLIFFTKVSSTLLGIIISILIITLALYTIIFRDKTIKLNSFKFSLIAFINSATLVSTGVGGALMAIAVISKGWRKNSIRGSLSLFYLLVEGLAVIGYIITDQYNKDIWLLSSIGIIPVILGFLMASKVISRVKDESHRRYLLTIIICAGSIPLLRETFKLF